MKFEDLRIGMRVRVDSMDFDHIENGEVVGLKRWCVMGVYQFDVEVLDLDCSSPNHEDISDGWSAGDITQSD